MAVWPTDDGSNLWADGEASDYGGEFTTTYVTLGRVRCGCRRRIGRRLPAVCAGFRSVTDPREHTRQYSSQDADRPANDSGWVAGSGAGCGRAAWGGAVRAGQLG